MPQSANTCLRLRMAWIEAGGDFVPTQSLTRFVILLRQYTKEKRTFRIPGGLKFVQKRNGLGLLPRVQ